MRLVKAKTNENSKKVEILGLADRRIKVSRIADEATVFWDMKGILPIEYIQ
jgi:hypothetical protein